MAGVAVDLGTAVPDEVLTISIDGDLRPPYQIRTDYYLPWENVAVEAANKQADYSPEIRRIAPPQRLLVR